MLQQEAWKLNDIYVSNIESVNLGQLKDETHEAVCKLGLGVYSIWKCHKKFK